ncbi:3-keto-steroid reductase [Thecaphora frezii]
MDKSPRSLPNGRGVTLAKRPIILVTGANAGVGFGICQRLIVQLSSPTPTDTLPTHPHSHPKHTRYAPSPFAASNGATIILACRNPIKAHKARRQLQQLLKWIENLPDHVDTPTGLPESWAYAFDDASKDDKLEDLYDEADLRANIPHEDADPALVAHAQESNVRQRRKLRSAAAVGSEADAHDEVEPDADSSTPASPDLDQPIDVREKRARAEYRRRFCQGTRIEFAPLDLGSMASALECARTVRARYPYLTHLILNAGSSAWVGLDWLHATWMMVTSFRYAVTWPAYKIQRAGDISDDGFGWVWQCNVGAHWILVRALLPSLRATPYSVSSRVIWTSSIEAFSHHNDPTDYECKDPVKSPLPYESTKYQCELAAFGLDHALQKRQIHTRAGTPRDERHFPGMTPADDARGGSTPASMSRSNSQGFEPDKPPASKALSLELEPRIFLAHPGIVASSIMAEFLYTWLELLMKLSFYIARLFRSPHHLIDPFKGAVSVTHVALAPAEQLDPKRRYGSRSDMWGREYVGSEQIDDWRPELGGAGPGVGARLALARIDADATYAGDGGGKVLAMARDYVCYCEKVAQKVWRNARAGELPPWSSLSDDSLDSTVPVDDVRPERKANGDEAELTKKTAMVPDSSRLGTEGEEWQKVEHQ